MQERIESFGEPAGTEVPFEQVVAQLRRILGSSRFAASDRRRAFLKFVVEEALAGRADRLKGFAIATAVFGRDDTFDPQVDPVVRLEARRLRRDLDGYYANAGQRDPVRISIPKGSYAPSFDWLDNGPSGGLAEPVRGSSPAGSASLAREPAVLVLPFEGLDGTESARYIGQGISHELVSNLFRFPGLQLHAAPPASSGRETVAPDELCRRYGADYAVTGSVRLDSKEVRVVAQLQKWPAGQIVWSKTYSRPSDPQILVRTQAEVASEIATAIGQPYGVVMGDMGRQPDLPAVSSMKSYGCVMRAYAFRHNFPLDEFQSVVLGLEETVRRDPKYADAWAMLGWLHVDSGRLGLSGDHNRAGDYEKGILEASRAVTLEPNNPLALKALAAAYHYVGRYDDSERLTRQAAAINPNDPEVLAQLGWRLAVRGKFEEGIPILEQAIERSLNPPSWYYHLVAIDLHRRGDYRGMLEVAERSALGDIGFSFLLLAIAHARLGHLPETRRALEGLARHRPLADDPVDYIRRHGATEEIIEGLSTGLEEARQFAGSDPLLGHRHDASRP